MEASSSMPETILKSADEKACGYTQLSQGKRHLVVSDIPEAVSTLALACELLAKQFGEMHVECAEAYFYYGKALLEMSRLESGVLGHALDGVPEGGDNADDSMVEDPDKMTEDERVDVEEKVKDALDFNYQTCAIELEKAEEEETESMDEDVPSQEGKVTEEGSKPVTPVTPATTERLVDSTTTTTEQMDDDEPGNLQLSWEMLELAKSIYTKTMEAAPEDKKVEYEKRLSETYLHLGEVSLENENFNQAIEDLTACLNKRQATLPADSRSIAETYYQLGVALAYNGRFSEAETSMSNAVEVLNSRIDTLKKMESSENLTKEILELQELVKDIQEKAADHQNLKAEKSTKLEEGFSGSESKSDKVASSIAVKRKDGDTAVAAN
jgi:nuclear autoantigenic sperm protein